MMAAPYDAMAEDHPSTGPAAGKCFSGFVGSSYACVCVCYLLDNDANGNSAGDHDGKINLRDEGATNLYNAHVHICRHTHRQERTSPHTLLQSALHFRTLSDSKPPSGLIKAPMRGPVQTYS